MSHKGLVPSASEEGLLCRCGQPAQLRRVQKKGPTYGRCESCESPRLGGTVVKVGELNSGQFFFAIERLSVPGSSRHLAPVVGRAWVEG